MKPCFAPILLATLLLALLSGCGEQPTKESLSGEQEEFKVGLLLPGPPSDAGWNAAAYEGLQLIKEELDATVNHARTTDPGSREEAFAGFAQQGYDLVFGHGYEYVEAATAIHADFPDTIFITTSGNETRKNVSAIVFELEEAVYLCGMIAGMMTDSGRVGLIGGMNIPSIESTFIAFKAGVLEVNSECRIAESFVGNWEDVNTAKELARAQIESGVDFIFHNADAAGQGVFAAAEEMKDRGIRVFGSNKNQNPVAPEVILASAVIDIPRGFLLVAREVKEGRFTPEVHRMTMADGIISLVYNPELKSAIPEEVLHRVEEKKQEIIAKEFKVPRGNF